MNDSHFALDMLAELRRSFDRSFAEAPRSDSEQLEDLLSIRVGGDAYAVRLSEAAGLYAGRKVVGLPGPLPELMGLAGFRGTVIPVFDLGACLGYGPAGEANRWVLLVRGGESAGLAFQEFEGHLRVGMREIARPGPSEPVRQHVLEFVSTEGMIRPVINLASVVQAVKRRVASSGPPEGA